MPFHNKVGLLFLEAKEEIQAALNDDVLQILKRNVQLGLGEDVEIEQERRVLLQKGQDEIVGVHVAGGVDVKSPVNVCRIVKGSPADNSKMIFENDLILSVNGKSLQGKTHQEAAGMIHDGGKYITLHLAKRKIKDRDEPDDGDSGKDDGNDDGDDKNIKPLNMENHTEWVVHDEIPLTTASITKYKAGTNEQRQNAFEVVSADGQSVVLYFDGSEEDRQEWYDSIYNNISLLNQQEVEAQNSRMIECEEKIIHMGFVQEQLSANPQWSNWKRKFLVLRRSHIEMFSTVPLTVSEWMRPERSYALTEISTELLQAAQTVRPECVKLIAGIGDSHIISFERHDDIVTWTNSIQCATALTAKQQQSARFQASWKGQNVNFIVDYDHGLLIQRPNDNVIVWHKTFQKLRNTSDDGNKKLTMEFADAGMPTQEVVELEDLNIAICTIQAFLAAKVADIDMAFIVQTGLISK
ncbi:gamma-2-syntrophin-like isoform X2 [Dysidea avara]|uniref:gamma-2-syntrophin-like isoform X2 n=1 Tax=Dysidea avara TaxID=196820 RepID=UPI00331CA0F5